MRALALSITLALGAAACSGSNAGSDVPLNLTAPIELTKADHSGAALFAARLDDERVDRLAPRVGVDSSTSFTAAAATGEVVSLVFVPAIVPSFDGVLDDRFTISVEVFPQGTPQPSRHNVYRLQRTALGWNVVGTRVVAASIVTLLIGGS